MVTILKVKHELSNNADIYSIYHDFIDIHGLSIFDRMLVKNSLCGDYEYLYLFLNQEELNTFINLLLEKNISIYSKEDYTETLVRIVIDNRINYFKNLFDDIFNIDELIRLFYESTITKDNVLDKALFNGFDSLTDDDYKVLKYTE